jgi:chromosomal replication initiator protein
VEVVVSSQIINVLKKKVAKKTWDNWFSTFELKSVEDDRVVFSVANLFIKDWLQTKYGGVINRSIHEATGKELPFEIVFKDGELSKEETVVHQQAGSLLKRKPLMISNLNPEYTFENFVVGEENRALYEVARDVTRNPGKYNPFFVHGGVGLGKTHLLQAIAQETMTNFPDKKVLYITSEQFMNDMIQSIKENNIQKFRDHYRKRSDVLLIDDIQFLIGKKGVQTEFFHSFNELHDAGKQLIICSDRNPEELDNFHSRLISRFQMGMLMTIQQPEAETRFHIAKKLAQRESVNLPDDVAMILANNIDGNLRRLRGAIIKLIVHSSVYNARIDISLASRILQSFASSPCVPSSQKPIDQIYDAVERIMKISREDIKGNSRSKEIVLARQLVMYILRQHFGKQVVEIARDTGKQHPTVIHSIKKIDKSVMMGRGSTKILYDDLIGLLSSRSAAV